jgi:hypothetical protein
MARRLKLVSFVGLALALVSIAAAPSGVSAEERRVGAWSVGVMKANEGTFATTGSDKGSVLGQYCYAAPGHCVWILAADLSCEAGNRYPALVNTEAGAAVLEILCLDLGGKRRFAFTDFDAIDGIVHKARTLRVALPTANGLFRVSRFSLEGASRAVALMRVKAEAMSGKPEPAATASAGVSF